MLLKDGVILLVKYWLTKGQVCYWPTLCHKLMRQMLKVVKKGGVTLLVKYWPMEGRNHAQARSLIKLILLYTPSRLPTISR